MLLLYLLLFDIELLITSQLQSYDIISKVVSLAYGKFLNEKKSETATNQRVIKNHLLDPMENFWHRHGKRAKKTAFAEEKVGSYFLFSRRVALASDASESLPFRYCSMISPAIGAAKSAPNPPCSI